MPPLNLAKSLALSFSLGAVLSVASDTAITHQVQQLAITQAQAVAQQAAHAGAKAARAVGAKLSEWAQDGMEALVKEVVKSSKLSK